jgi:hypothetical protein
MSRETLERVRDFCQTQGISEECEALLGYGIFPEDLLTTLERIQRWSLESSMRRWNLYREIINTIRNDSVFLKSFLSIDCEKRKRCMATLRSLYQVEPLNYRDRLMLLTKFILAQINPLGNPEIREQAAQMIREFITHPNGEVRDATFRGMTFEVARLRQKGGGWYVQPLIDMLVEALQKDPETREYIRTESTEVYYTQEQRDVVDDILVAVALGLSSEKGGDKR